VGLFIPAERPERKALFCPHCCVCPNFWCDLLMFCANTFCVFVPYIAKYFSAVNGSVYWVFWIGCIIYVLAEKRKRSESFSMVSTIKSNNSLSSSSQATFSHSSLDKIPLFSTSVNCWSTGFNFRRFADPLRNSCLTDLQTIPALPNRFFIVFLYFKTLYCILGCLSVSWKDNNSSKNVSLF
jgi:hypothetical protein